MWSKISPIWGQRSHSDLGVRLLFIEVLRNKHWTCWQLRATACMVECQCMPHKMLCHINVSQSMCHNESHCVATSVTQNLVTLIRPSRTNDREFSPYSASTSLSFKNKIFLEWLVSSFWRVIRPPRGNTLHKHSSADTQAQPSLFLAAVKLAAVTAATTTAREQRSLSTQGAGCMDTREGPSSLPALAQNARLRPQGTRFTSL